MVLVTRVKNHEQHKLELLKRINKYEADENMRWDHYYGDYQVSPFVEQSEAPEYMKYFYDNMAQDILRSVGNKLGLGLYNAEVHKLWYQRYEKKDFHDFHNHAGCHFANCYFLELPDNKYKTQIFDRTSEIQYNAKEGDVITFPAYLAHRSPINESQDIKTIIAWNSSYGKLGSEEIEGNNPFVQLDNFN